MFFLGYTYRVTHRCHDRSFLFRFARDRDTYRKMLRARLASFDVSLLNYCNTSNHVHLLLRMDEGAGDTLGKFMQSVEGAFARYYNRRKKRSGAFWSDRYHAVMIDSGESLWRCLQYIDLNMVRAGVVQHPEEWDWCGYNELVGRKRRNRLIDQKQLVQALGDGTAIEHFRTGYQDMIRTKVELAELQREAYWTEALAVGSTDFTREVGKQIPNRMNVSVEEASDRATWIVKEEQSVYGGFDSKNRPIRHNTGIRRFVNR
ncbi:MAG: transposase [Verrucomicrobia bacterium]|nr:transposase [Verrucomicrobiota bacterium]